MDSLEVHMIVLVLVLVRETFMTLGRALSPLPTGYHPLITMAFRYIGHHCITTSHQDMTIVQIPGPLHHFQMPLPRLITIRFLIKMAVIMTNNKGFPSRDPQLPFLMILNEPPLNHPHHNITSHSLQNQ